MAATFIEELFECPICLNVMRPLVRCKMGHSICGDCKGNLGKITEGGRPPPTLG